jgi:hypothetical protein
VSQPATETRTTPVRTERTAGSSSGFSLTKRYGPLPAWAWGLLGGGAIYAGYKWLHKSGTSATTTTTSATTTATGQGFDYGPSYAAIQSEIQQLQGEQSVLSAGTSVPTTGTTSATTGTTSATTTSTTASTTSATTADTALNSSGGPPAGVVGMRVDQAVAQLESQGYQIGTVTLIGIAGVRNSQVLQPSQYDQYVVLATTVSGNTVTIEAS